MGKIEKAFAAIVITCCACGSFARIATAQEAVVYSFEGAPLGDASFPVTDLLADAKGNFFGGSEKGGTYNGGTVFELSPVPGGGWIDKVLYSFPMAEIEDSREYSSLTQDAKGNLYGTTVYGGSSFFNGSVYELSPTPGGAWAEKVIYNFGSSATDGSQPRSRVILDAEGNLYGTTFYLHSDDQGFPSGYGTVFELSPSTTGSWTEKVLYTFGATNTDGLYPVAGLVFDPSGNLYGTAEAGGLYQDHPASGIEVGAGIVFELTRQSNASWTETILHNFNPSTGDGLQPSSNLLLDSKGDLYGTTPYGGNNGQGTVFELSPTSQGAWTEKLFRFTDASSGYSPSSGLTMDAHGNFYGTTTFYSYDGSSMSTDGAVFKLAPQPDGTLVETALHLFPQRNATDGSTPSGGVVVDSKGNVYGTTVYGGAFGVGTLFGIGPGLIKAPTGTMTTLVSSGGSNLVAGQPISLSATVVPVGGTGTPTGTVTFTEPDFGRGVTIPLDQTGTAFYAGGVPPPGTYSVVAHYNGAQGFPASTSVTLTATVTAPAKK